MASGFYLTQNFDPDLPGTQVFVAPGPEEIPLTEVVSPWVFARSVRFPARVWHRLLLAIRDVDAQAAALLDAWSGSADPNENEGSRPQEADAIQVERVLDRVALHLRAGDFVSDEELTALGDLTREDLAAMLGAVRLVIVAARKAGEPFWGWYE
jgi:hypothetical protein